MFKEEFTPPCYFRNEFESNTPPPKASAMPRCFAGLLHLKPKRRFGALQGYMKVRTETLDFYSIK